MLTVRLRHLRWLPGVGPSSQHLRCPPTPALPVLTAALAQLALLPTILCPISLPQEPLPCALLPLGPRQHPLPSAPEHGG